MCAKWDTDLRILNALCFIFSQSISSHTQTASNHQSLTHNSRPDFDKTWMCRFSRCKHPLCRNCTCWSTQHHTLFVLLIFLNCMGRGGPQVQNFISYYTHGKVIFSVYLGMTLYVVCLHMRTAVQLVLISLFPRNPTVFIPLGINRLIITTRT